MGSWRSSFVWLDWSEAIKHAHKQYVHTPAPAHKLVLTHWPQTQRTRSFSLFEQDAWLHWVPSAETPQQELEHKRVQHVHTHRGLMDYGSLSRRALSAGLADWTETPCRPRGEPEGWVNTKLMERAPVWECLISGRAQLGDDMEPSRWPNSRKPPHH